MCCTPSEAMLMHHAARLARPDHALEIGSYIGWSSAHLASGLASCELTCVEPFLETGGAGESRDGKAALAHRRFLRNMERAGVSDNVTLIRDKSPDAIPALSETRRWDFIFVDGWHLQGQPLKDVIGVLPYAAPGGVILLHDLWIADVRDALLYLATHGWSYRIFDTANYLTIVWRGDPAPWLSELFAIAEREEFVLPSARARKFIFGLVDDSLAVAKSAFAERRDV